MNESNQTEPKENPTNASVCVCVNVFGLALL